MKPDLVYTNEIYKSLLIFFDNVSGKGLGLAGGVFGHSKTGTVVSAKTTSTVGEHSMEAQGASKGTLHMWNRHQFTPANRIRYESKVKAVSLSNTRMRWGMCASLNYGTLVPTRAVWFEYDSLLSANIRLVTYSGASTYADSGVAMDTNYHRYNFEVTTGNVDFYQDGVLLGTNTTGVPSDRLQLFYYIEHTSTAESEILIDYTFVIQKRA